MTKPATATLVQPVETDKAAPAAAKPAEVAPASPPVAGPAVRRRRHNVIGLTFLSLVVVPLALCIGYLTLVAKDQYHSTVGFSVQTESGQTMSGILSGLSQLTGAQSSASDQEILYQYIQSQDIVAELDAQFDLRSIYSRNWPSDPVFAFNPAGTIEDLHRFWLRNVEIVLENTGLTTVKVKAPTAAEAQALAAAIFDHSSVLVNNIASVTREDTLRYSRDELATAEGRLTGARQEMTAFRLRTQIVDPTVDLQGQMGILNSLQARLVEGMIELDKLGPNVGENDPRRVQVVASIESIERLIEAERRKFGEGGQGPGGADYATLFSEYERLWANLQFAESAYQSAVAGYDMVLANAARQSRYLVAHVRPTLSERALYPERLQIAAMFGGFVFLLWALGVLVYYSVRDRR